MKIPENTEYNSDDPELTHGEIQMEYSSDLAVQFIYRSSKKKYM